MLPPYLIALIAIGLISLVALIAYGADKRKAKKRCLAYQRVRSARPRLVRRRARCSARYEAVPPQNQALVLLGGQYFGTCLAKRSRVFLTSQHLITKTYFSMSCPSRAAHFLYRQRQPPSRYVKLILRPRSTISTYIPHQIVGRPPQSGIQRKPQPSPPPIPDRLKRFEVALRNFVHLCGQSIQTLTQLPTNTMIHHASQHHKHRYRGK